MSLQSVAFRYAKSLIGLASERGVLETVQTDMKFFTEICHQNRDFVLALQSPVVKHQKKLDILKALFENKVSATSFSIFDIITKKNREAVLPAVAEEFQRQYAELKGIQKAFVTTVTPLTDDQRKAFTKTITDATGKTVELVESLDETLIGGYVIRVGDRQIDTSIKNKLNDLKLKFA